MMELQTNNHIDKTNFGELKEVDDSLKKRPRHYSKSIQDNEFETPWELYFKLERETRVRFELDPFATQKNAKCSFYFTKETNAFATDWLLPNNHIPTGVFVNHPHQYHELAIKTVTTQYIKWGFPVVMIIPSNTERTTYYDYYIERFRIGAKIDYDKYPKVIKTFPIKGAIKFLKDGKKTNDSSRNAYKVIHWQKKIDCLPNIDLMEYFR